jgi:hypothetical protein
MAVAVSVTPTTVSVKAGQNTTIVPTVTGGTTNTVTWTSSAATKATVGSSGIVHGLRSGTTTITATSTEDGTKTATCVVTVTVAVAAAAVASTLLTGETTQINASVTGSLADSTLDYAIQSGKGSVNSSGLYTAGVIGSDVVRTSSHEDSSQFVDVALTVSGLIAGKHRLDLVDQHNEYIQNLLVKEMARLTPGNTEWTLAKAAHDSIRGFGN